MTLGDTMVLQIDDTRGRHLNRSEDGHNLQHAVVKTGSNKAVVLFVASPEIGTAHKTGDVEYNNALETGQWDSGAIAFQKDALLEVLVRFLIFIIR